MHRPSRPELWPIATTPDREGPSEVVTYRVGRLRLVYQLSRTMMGPNHRRHAGCLSPFGGPDFT